MKAIGIVFTCLTAVSLLGCTSAESYSRKGYNFNKVEKVAVIEVVGSAKDEAACHLISDFFVMELLEKGYSPVALPQTQELLKEQFPDADINNCDVICELGKKLNAPALLYVQVHKLGQDISMTAKMVDAENCSILWMGSGEGSAGSNTLYTLGGLTKKNSDEQDISPIERRLTSNEENAVRDVVNRICDTIPDRFADSDRPI